ncbi:bifunctional adenosylcobinamide kinase/adenosylcobinamide-phosphate guanylyltransferase [Paenibacillus sp. P96]|uniref:Adenosylcobinamide kinase n=1 Tax=Paenibacillus zeirhizosphaerae TaxID=2987519 RepID=A0ABT9FKR2_9BACL|nr:bifunctional adenosylcobinamide kinase/adenosylcobinamide-phosphate guanylyltransferase [Paenibacillus sp. P96]MDP4095312.1 bifunctional adenosylcobinamide kinase/adenosylcobinamide-phosphate guanylyltransferase [Paenibacillus sp. P96]
MKSLITGGARSGKSSFAERLCMSRAGEAVYVATAQAFDDEMKERIALHRSQRSVVTYPWRTLEEPLDLPDLLNRLASNGEPPAVLVDCLTLWLSNVLLAAGNDGEAAAREAIERLVEASSSYPGELMLVTNEVGSGIVPEYPLGRLYRDLSGMMNQRVAGICEEVFLVTAGVAVELKRLEYRL